jgi:hypothetical protein
MALPKQVGDNVVFESRGVEASAKPISSATDKDERVTDILIRAHPGNAGIVYAGDSNSQPWPLQANESLAIAVTQRAKIFYRGDPGDTLLIVTVTGNANMARAGASPGSPRSGGYTPPFPEAC